jgi:hypothetical protein
MRPARRPDDHVTDDVTGSFSWTGALGLAPGWATAPLDLNGQELVSACLRAHANSIGRHVATSLWARDPIRPRNGPQELALYGVGDAMFTGNGVAGAPLTTRLASPC